MKNPSIQYALKHGATDVENIEKILIEALSKPIAYHRIFRRITGKAVAAIMLSQAWYWTPRSSTGDGWFWKTQEEWEEETGLSRDEQETARKHLKARGFLQEKLQGIPAKMNFKVDTSAVVAAIVADVLGKPQVWCNAPYKDGALLSDKNVETHQTFNTEITTENTTLPLSEKPREATETPEAVEEEVTYEDCDEQGNPLTGKKASRPKWSIPEDHPVLKEAMRITKRKWFKDRNETAKWKMVKDGLAHSLITIAWTAHCLEVANKMPMSLYSLLAYMANIEKMRDWEVGQGVTPNQSKQGIIHGQPVGNFS